jgi:non-ribosomal peptide synthetase component F
VQYVDFAVWQRAWLQGEALDEQLGYWRRKLAGNLPFLDLPVDGTPAAGGPFRGGLHELRLPSELVRAVEALARRERATAFVVYLAAFKSLLHFSSGQTDILVGSPIAGRVHQELEPLIGFFLNTLLLRTDLSGDPALPELLRRVRETALEAYSHQSLPFDRLVSGLNLERDPASSRLSRIWFNFQNTPLREPSLRGLALSPLRIGAGRTKFELAVNLTPAPAGMQVVFEYAADIFAPLTIARWAAGFQFLLENWAASPAGRLSDLTASLAEHQREWQASQGRQMGAAIQKSLSVARRKSVLRPVGKG